MQKEQIGINLYSVRELISGPDSFTAVLEQIRNIGYRAVELYEIPTGISPSKIRKVCDSLQLAICGIHSLNVVDDYKTICSVLNELDSEYVCYPYPEGIDLLDIGQLKELIYKLNKAGKYLKSCGKTLTYHNHQIEFQFHNGKLILDQILDGTDSLNVQFELDVYWIQNGGSNPENWIEKLNDRLPQIHLKDYRINSKGNPVSCQLGMGNLDMKKIISKAEKSGCKWFIVEQEDFSTSPITELACSYKFLEQFVY
jgi:sugar phosphate isomerase/epimerase